MKTVTGEPMIWLRDLDVAGRAGARRPHRARDRAATTTPTRPARSRRSPAPRCCVLRRRTRSVRRARCTTNAAGIAGFATPADVAAARHRRRRPPPRLQPAPPAARRHATSRSICAASCTETVERSAALSGAAASVPVTIGANAERATRATHDRARPDRRRLVARGGAAPPSGPAPMRSASRCACRPGCTTGSPRRRRAASSRRCRRSSPAVAITYVDTRARGGRPLPLPRRHRAAAARARFPPTSCRSIRAGAAASEAHPRRARHRPGGRRAGARARAPASTR